MKKFRELSGQIKEKDEREYDYEGDMAKTQLKTIIRNAETIHDMLEDNENLPEWVQSKITLAKDYIVVAANYLESEMDEEKETGFQKTFRKNTGERYEQYANRRAKEEDERQEQMKKQKEDYIKQGIIKAESVELDEARYPGFRPGLGLGKRGAPSQRDNYKDFNDGRPFGFTPIKDKNETEKKKPKNEEVELDEVSADVAKHVAQARDRSAVANKLTSTQSRRLKMGDKGGDPDMNAAKALKSAMKRGAKNVYGEEVEQLEEKNEPTNPELWSRAKSLAKSKFDVYPSAYANGWASKWYKSKGGGWRSVSEETDLDEGYFKKQEIERQETERLAKRNDPPFTPDKPKKRSVVVGKKPEGYSRARQLARQAMQKYIKPVKEEKDMSKKAKVVKDIMKKSSDDKFQAKPELSDSVTKTL